MDDIVSEPETFVAQPAWPPRRNRTPWLVVGAAVVVLGAGVGIGTAVGHGSSSTPAAASSSAEPLALAGTITVPFLGTDLFAPQAVDQSTGTGAAPLAGDTCTTTGGFTDISQGAAVTIGGPDGKTIAVIALSAGTVAGDAGSTAQCRFDFDTSVPPGLSEYTVTISHRGTQVFTPEQVREGQVALTLGAP